MEIKMICNDGSVDTCRDATLLAVGTHGLGKTTCSYSKLVARFGEPKEGDGFKTQAEWIILTPYGLATLYDWKQGDCYHGEGNGTPIDQVEEWSVGGYNPNVIEWINRAISK